MNEEICMRDTREGEQAKERTVKRRALIAMLPGIIPSSGGGSECRRSVRRLTPSSHSPRFRHYVATSARVSAALPSLLTPPRGMAFA